MIAAEQVLICPTCQGTHDWQASLDRCADCGSVLLVRQLGETRCKACGVVGDSVAGSAPVVASVDVTLSDQVAAALQKRFGSVS